MKKLILLSAALLVSACATPPAKITSRPAQVQFLTTAPNGRIVDKTTKTTVRAFAAIEGSKTKEVSGAQCTLTSDHIRANVVTPQVVMLPKYDQDKKLKNRGVPPSILVTCRAGNKSGSTLLAAKPGKIISGSGNLFVDMVLIAGSAAAATTADWRYSEFANVVMK
ncbi:MAG: hypothetical protein ACPGVK_03005 [Halocynthiibacter sp.]